jgi:Flp pilus assembly protein TadG
MNRINRRSDRGAALVEAAIVMPLLLMLTVGIWTTARAWNIHNVLDQAVREAARFGATSDPFSPSDVTNVWSDALTSSSVNPADVTACVAFIGPDAPCFADSASGNRVQVDLTIDADLDFVFWSRTVTLDAKAVSRYEPVP